MPASDSRTAARRRGDAGESRARSFLEQQGLTLLDAGWQCRLGELDLVMRTADVLVFVEVRARQQEGIVSALESVSPAKQSRFVRAARAWLMAHPVEAQLPARFDIVAIDGESLTWHVDAFSVSSR